MNATENAVMNAHEARVLAYLKNAVEKLTPRFQHAAVAETNAFIATCKHFHLRPAYLRGLLKRAGITLRLLPLKAETEQKLLALADADAAALRARVAAYEAQHPTAARSREDYSL